MAKPGKMLAPAGIKSLINVGLESCKSAVESGGSAEFSFALDGQYSVDKDGSIGIKADVAYVDGLPINVQPSAGSTYETDGSGNISILFKMRVGKLV